MLGINDIDNIIKFLGSDMILGKELFGGLVIGEYQGRLIIISTKSAEMKLSYEEGITYCKNARFNSYEDWYLPTFKELSFIYHNTPINSKYIFENEMYWSSTEYSLNKDKAYLKFFGGTSEYQRFKHSEHLIRPIRSIQI